MKDADSIGNHFCIRNFVPFWDYTKSYLLLDRFNCSSADRETTVYAKEALIIPIHFKRIPLRKKLDKARALGGFSKIRSKLPFAE